MLIEFRVGNFRSIRSPQTLTLTKAAGGELMVTNTFRTQAVNEFELLRSAAIYGANAAGKTNILKAMYAMKKTILESATDLKRGDKLPVTPFRLHGQTREAPSEFEAAFIIDQVRYQYGFSATPYRIHEEWLYAYPRGRAQRWFTRKWDESAERYSWELGNNLSGEKQVWLKATRDNALFLSTAIQLNSVQLQPVYDWFNKTLRVASIDGWSPGFSAALCEKQDKDHLIAYLRAADISIDDIKVERKPFDINQFPSDMPQELREKLFERLADKSLLKIQTIHKTVDGEVVTFELQDESDGTQKLFAFAGPWLDTLTHGYVLFIDELQDNLHPKLVQFLVELFHSDATNPKNAQLVFTTHETSILSQDVFRRDQIWFCEKDTDQSTLLYPLTDFSPRKGRENLELAYLSGRYGAVPNIKPLRSPAG